MSEAIEASLPALAKECGALQRTAGQFDEIVQAGSIGDGLSPQAFGILCSFFTPPAVIIQTIEVDAIKAVQRCVAKTSAAVGACESDYQQTDRSVAQSYKHLEGNGVLDAAGGYTFGGAGAI